MPQEFGRDDFVSDRDGEYKVCTNGLQPIYAKTPEKELQASKIKLLGQQRY